MQEPTLGARLAQAFEGFATSEPGAVDALLADYAEDAVFEDPFQRVEGKPAVAKAFRAMVRAASAMQIRTSDRLESNDRVWFAWRFDFRPKRGPTIVIEGATLFRIREGRVVHHRDYWDTVETLGLTFPGLKRLTKRLLGAPG